MKWYVLDEGAPDYCQLDHFDTKEEAEKAFQELLELLDKDQREDISGCCMGEMKPIKEVVRYEKDGEYQYWGSDYA